MIPRSEAGHQEFDRARRSTSDALPATGSPNTFIPAVSASEGSVMLAASRPSQAHANPAARASLPTHVAPALHAPTLYNESILGTSRGDTYPNTTRRESYPNTVLDPSRQPGFPVHSPRDPSLVGRQSVLATHIRSIQQPRSAFQQAETWSSLEPEVGYQTVHPHPFYTQTPGYREGESLHAAPTLSPSAASSTSPWSRPGPDARSSGPLRDPYADRISLYIRQQPRAARAGPDGKDRRPIDPPPVLQLMIKDFDATSEADIEQLHEQFVVHCKLVSANSPRRDVSTLASLAEDGSRDVQRLLLGMSAASPFHTKDDPDPETMRRHPVSGEEIDRPGSPSSRFFSSATSPNSSHRRSTDVPSTFFIFADLSIRKAGEYRLEFSLMKMDPRYLVTGESLPTIYSCASQVFRVVNAKDFDQVQPSTSLVKGLVDRGAGFPLKLKKGTREGGRRRVARLDYGSDDDQDEYEMEE